jgi:DNA polymerase-1
MKKKFYIIDGNSLVYRAFFAVPPFATTKGIPTNAVFGFTKMLLKIINEKQPDYLVVVFDAKGPTFRSETFEQYKAHRPKMPDELVLQKPYIRRMVEGLNIPVFEVPGIEADDVIGTMAKRFSSDSIEIVIVTGDKDLLQLVEDGKIWVYDTMKDMLYQRQEVYEKLGVYPERVIDLLALMGDSSDHIPGVRGIGPKTALKLLHEYGSLEEIYQHLSSIQGSVHDKLLNDKELAFMSYMLATIKTDIPLDLSLEDLVIKPPNLEGLLRLCDELEFTSLKKDILQLGAFEPSLYEPPKPVHEKRYITVTDTAMLNDILDQIRQKKRFAFDTETTSLDPLEAQLVGISLSFQEHVGYYVPLTHKHYPHNLDKQYVLDQLVSLLNDDSIQKIGHNIKYDLAVIKEEEKRLSARNASSSRQNPKGKMDLFSSP